MAVPIWKDYFVSLGSVASQYFRVRVNNTTIYQGKAVRAASSGTLYIRINDICADYMSQVVPELNASSARGGAFPMIPNKEEEMDIYFAGGVTGNLRPYWQNVARGKTEPNADMLDVNILESYAYLRGAGDEYPRLFARFKSFLLDSGAFTFMQGKGGAINWDQYIAEYAEYINRYHIDLGPLAQIEGGRTKDLQGREGGRRPADEVGGEHHRLCEVQNHRGPQGHRPAEGQGRFLFLRPGREQHHKGGHRHP